MQYPANKCRVFQNLAIILIITFLAACTPAENTPQVWVDSPKDGTHYDKVVPLTIIAHASNSGGIGYVTLGVNGIPYTQQTPGETGAKFSSFTYEWIPPGDGSYTLEITVYDTKGVSGGRAFSRIQVGNLTLDDPTMVVPENEVTLEVITLTPPPDLPTATLTATATETPLPPLSIKFYTDKLSISPGECVQLSWTVEQADEVLLDNARVTPKGVSQACPEVTHDYVMTAKRGLETAYEYITITVYAPADTTPPPVPQPQVPANGLSIGCKASQTLAWLPVSDPSGIKGYDIKLFKNINGSWQSVQSWNGITTKQVSANVICGLEYRWAVRAVDNAGNISSWSSWVTFVIELS
jgi:hypothetical protein